MEYCFRYTKLVFFAFVCAFVTGGGCEQKQPSVHKEQKKPDIRFLSDDGTVIPLILEQYPPGSRQGRIVSSDSTITGLPYDLGTVWYGFGCPCVLESETLKSQIVLIPYSVGGGTGVSVGEWCIVIASGRNLYIKKMGLWHSHSYMNDEYYSNFQLSPAWRYGPTREGPVFEFKATSCRNGKEKILKGQVALKILLTQNGFEADLTPLRAEDALQCVNMLNKVDYARSWILECLKSIVPKYVQSLQGFKYDIPEQNLNDLRDVIKEYYVLKELSRWQPK